MINIFKEKILKFYSDKNLYLLFSIWLVTFFFGSTIGSLSLGFFTIYPNFLIGFLFIPIIIKCFNSFQKPVKTFIFFLSLFILYSVVWILLNEKNYYSIFELRSNLFYLNTFLIIFSTYSSFESKLLFNKALKIGVWIWFSSILLFGFMEILFDFHFKAEFYSTGEPMFIFGNPNDYILNCILIFSTLLFIDKQLTDNLLLLIVCLVLLLILSYFAKARVSELIILLLFGFVFFKNLRRLNFILAYKYYILLFFTCILLLIGNSILIKEDGTGEFKVFSYFKNLIKTEYLNQSIDSTSLVRETSKILIRDSALSKIRIRNISSIESSVLIADNKKKSTNFLFNKNISFFDETLINDIEDPSLKVRIKLIFNGIYLIKTNPILGVGPGQFQQQNILKKVPNDIGTNCSPHNYFIELISNYGILGLAFFVYIFYLFFRLIRLRNEYWLIITFIIFLISSLIPSAFTYQPINWLFMALWLLYSQISITNKSCQIRNL